MALLALQRRVVGLGDLPGLTMEGLYAPAWGAALAQAGLQGAAAQLTKLVAVLAAALEPLATSDLASLGLDGAVELLPLLGAGGLFSCADGRVQLLHKPFGSWLATAGAMDAKQGHVLLGEELPKATVGLTFMRSSRHFNRHVNPNIPLGPQPH